MNGADVPEEFSLTGAPKPKTVDAKAAIFGGVAGAVLVVPMVVSSAPAAAFAAEGVVAGTVAGFLSTNSKITALDGAVAAVLGGIFGILALVGALVAVGDGSLAAEAKMTWVLSFYGLGVLIFLGPMVAVPGAILATVTAAARRKFDVYRSR